jgi:hypothetical protein
MSLYNEPTYHFTIDDEAVTITPEARTAAALYWLADWFGLDADSIAGCLDDLIEEGIPMGNVNDDLSIQLDEELKGDYHGKPEACLSWLTSAVVGKRKREAVK